MSLLLDLQRYLKMNRETVFVFVMSLILIITVLIQFLPIYVRLQNLSFNVACSILTVLILFFLEKIILKKDEDSILLNNLKASGVVNIYETRQEMNKKTNLLLEEAKYLKLASLGASGLLDFKGDLLIKKLNESNFRIQFLVPKFDIQLIKILEDNEGATLNSIKDSISKMTEWVENLKAKLSQPDRVEIREYEGFVMESIMIIDGNMFVGPFQKRKKSQLTIATEYIKNGSAFQYYESYFDRIWAEAINIEANKD